MVRILVVDDQSVITMQLEESLTASGYEVVGTANSGEKGVEMAKRLKPDLILMDIVMSGKLDGIAAAGLIKAELDIPVVFLTAYSGEQLIQRAKQVEPYGYILKPFQMSEVIAAIEVANHKIQIERRLRESENRLSLAVSAGRVGVWDWNLGTDEMYICRNLKGMLGYKNHEIDNHLDNWVELIHPDDLEHVMDEAKAVIEGTKPHYEVEHRMVHKDGSIRWFVTGGSTIQGEAGKPSHMMGTNVCITERKKMEETLRESEERFRDLLDHIPGVSIQGYTADGIVRYWNKASEKVYGYSAEEAMGKNLADLIIPPDLKPHFKESLEVGAKATKTGEFRPAGELMLLHKNGHLVPVHSIHTVVCLKDKPPLLFCIDVDLSERKRTERELRESEAYSKTLLESLNVGIIVIGPETHEIVDINSFAAKMIGVAEDQILGQRCHKYVCPAEEGECPVTDLKQTLNRPLIFQSACS